MNLYCLVSYRILPRHRVHRPGTLCRGLMCWVIIRFCTSDVGAEGYETGLETHSHDHLLCVLSSLWMVKEHRDD